MQQTLGGGGSRNEHWPLLLSWNRLVSGRGKLHGRGCCCGCGFWWVCSGLEV